MWALRWAYWRGADPRELARRYYGVEPRHPPTLQVFAKAPVPGRVKTRLARTIGAEAAASAYRALAERTLATAAAARRAGVVGAIELWLDPESDPAAIAPWRDRFGVTIETQAGDDLGARMRNALRSSIARGIPALLIGTDVPGYDVAYLAHAAAALERHDAVVGPAEDGGYVLVGLARDIDVVRRRSLEHAGGDGGDARAACCCRREPRRNAAAVGRRHPRRLLALATSARWPATAS